MVLLILGASYLSNKLIITGKFHIVEEDTDSELVISSYPNNAEVYLGKNYVGKSPATLTSLSPGVYEVTVRKPGFGEVTDHVYLGKNQNKNVFLKIESMFGKIYVESDPSGADIFVDGLKKGITPKLIDDLSEGTHTIKITKEFYKEYIGYVTATNKLNKIFFKLDEKTAINMREPLYSDRV